MNLDEPTIVLFSFQAASPEAAPPLRDLLSNYAHVTRANPALDSIVLAQSALDALRFTIIEVWNTVESQKFHFESQIIFDLADNTQSFLAKTPEIDVCDPLALELPH